MMSLGILNDSPTKFNKNILSIKLNVFRFLNTILYSRESLFPQLTKGSFLGLISRGAVPCAADDLELFSTNAFDFTFELGTSDYRPTGMDSGLQTFESGFGGEKPKYEHHPPLENQYNLHPSSEGFVSPEEDESWKCGLINTRQSSDSSASTTSSRETDKFNFDMHPLACKTMSDYEIDRLFHDLTKDLPKSQPHHHPESHLQVSSAQQPPVQVPAQVPAQRSVQHSVQPPVQPLQFVPQYCLEQTVPKFKNGTNVNDVTDVNRYATNIYRKKEKVIHECPYCETKFKVKGYLTRHIKKHYSSKAFYCPFYNDYKKKDKHMKCHPTGGFTRRDTYKTHLRAIHFKYPRGTKSTQRSSVGGHCRGCLQWFENNQTWLELHIEKEDCPGTAEHTDVKEEEEEPQQDHLQNEHKSV